MELVIFSAADAAKPFFELALQGFFISVSDGRRLFKKFALFALADNAFTVYQSLKTLNSFFYGLVGPNIYIDNNKPPWYFCMKTQYV